MNQETIALRALTRQHFSREIQTAALRNPRVYRGAVLLALN